MSDPDGGQAILTVKESAAHLRLGLSTMYRLVEDGTIPAVKVPGTNIVRIRRSVLDSLLSKWEGNGRRRRGGAR